MRWFSTKMSIQLGRAQKTGLIIFAVVALLHSFIANEDYILAKTSSGIQFFYEGDADWGVKAIVPYSASSIDRANRLRGPFDSQEVQSLYYRHWLGTDDIGRDVLAGLVYGTYIALQVGFYSMLISLFISFVLAYLGAYHGDKGIRIETRMIFPAVLISALFLFYASYTSTWSAIILMAAIIMMWIYLANRKSSIISRTKGVPFDLAIQRLIDIVDSMPGLFLILILLTLFAEPSIANVILVIVFLRWPVVTRHLRAEILKIREEEYILSAKSAGQKDIIIYLKHVLPMAFSPIIIVASFGIAAAILTESTLSFLGIGIPLDEVSWGSLIKRARFNFQAWWMALFPGLAIYLVVILFNSVGERVNARMRGLDL
ncbi:MAG: ABC transporter permease [Saprospiraceae bacterium]|jgi:peptide/nickel transport system permease protein